jgi:hypothetical protein
MTADRSISWLALKAGTTVRAKDGEDAGEVTEVVGDTQKDIFSGIRFKDGLLGASRFAPAASVERITTDEVILSLDPGEIEALGPEA